MAVTVVGMGAVATSTAAITPAFPASITSGDIILIVAECEGVTTPGTYTLPSGWAHVTGSPVQQSTNTRLTVLWRRYDGVFTAPSIGDSGDHNVGRTIAFRGCPATGNPWNVVATAVSATSSTACTWPGATTTVANTMVCEIISTGTDTTTAQLGTLANANYTSITTRINNWTSSGNGGGIGLVTGLKATAGATGQSTMTLVAAGTKAFMTLALAPAAIAEANADNGTGTGAAYDATITTSGINRGQSSGAMQHITATSLVVTWPALPAAGSTVLLFVQCADGATPSSVVDNGTTPRTFTLDASNTSSGGAFVYRANNITLPGAGSYTVTVTTSSAHAMEAWGSAYSSVASGVPSATNNGSGTGTSVSTGSVTVPAGGLVFGGFSDSSALNPETITFTNAAMIERGQETNGSTTMWCMAVADGIIPTGGSQAGTWTLGDSIAWAGAIATYAVASSGGTGNADNGAGTGAAYDASVSTKPSADVATPSGAANDVIASVKPSADCATGTGTVTDAYIAAVDDATGTGAAQDASVSAKPSADVATPTSAAYDATVSTTAAGTGNADCPIGTGAGYDATIAYGYTATITDAVGTVDTPSSESTTVVSWRYIYAAKQGVS